MAGGVPFDREHTLTLAVCIKNFSSWHRFCVGPQKFKFRYFRDPKSDQDRPILLETHNKGARTTPGTVSFFRMYVVAGTTDVRVHFTAHQQRIQKIVRDAT